MKSLIYIIAIVNIIFLSECSLNDNIDENDIKFLFHRDTHNFILLDSLLMVNKTTKNLKIKEFEIKGYYNNVETFSIINIGKNFNENTKNQIYEIPETGYIVLSRVILIIDNKREVTINPNLVGKN